MFGILVYVAFRYELSFAVGAVVAIIHDVLMTMGWYFLVGRELNTTTVAALLTMPDVMDVEVTGCATTRNAQPK